MLHQKLFVDGGQPVDIDLLQIRLLNVMIPLVLMIKWRIIKSIFQKPAKPEFPQLQDGIPSLAQMALKLKVII